VTTVGSENQGAKVTDMSKAMIVKDKWSIAWGRHSWIGVRGECRNLCHHVTLLVD
jgi:hypothetical protein